MGARETSTGIAFPDAGTNAYNVGVMHACLVHDGRVESEVVGVQCDPDNRYVERLPGENIAALIKRVNPSGTARGCCYPCYRPPVQQSVLLEFNRQFGNNL